MSRIAAMDMTCVLDCTETCNNCGECEDSPICCCMDSMKECDSCLCC